MGKAVGGFIVLFGVSIVVVPMTVVWQKEETKGEKNEFPNSPFLVPPNPRDW